MIDLNGKKVSGGITVNSQTSSSLTIVDNASNGQINGNINAPTSKLTITGGTYATNPTNYIKVNTLKAYGGNGSWSVEPKITATNFGVNPTSLSVRQGQTSSIGIIESSVTKTVDVEVLPVLTSVNAEDITIRIGKNDTIKPVVKDTNITGATFS